MFAAAAHGVIGPGDWGANGAARQWPGGVVKAMAILGEF